MSYTEEMFKSLGNRVTVNMPSVIALGYGPISEKRLSDLVASGKVFLTQKGNEIYCHASTTSEM